MSWFMSKHYICRLVVLFFERFLTKNHFYIGNITQLYCLEILPNYIVWKYYPIILFAYYISFLPVCSSRIFHTSFTSELFELTAISMIAQVGVNKQLTTDFENEFSEHKICSPFSNPLLHGSSRIEHCFFLYSAIVNSLYRI